MIEVLQYKGVDNGLPFGIIILSDNQISVL
jgi:hypothetical protein